MDIAEWGMFTEEGDQAVAEMMRELKDDLAVHALPKVREKLKQKMKEIEQVQLIIGACDENRIRQASQKILRCRILQTPGSPNGDDHQNLQHP